MSERKYVIDYAQFNGSVTNEMQQEITTFLNVIKNSNVPIVLGTVLRYSDGSKITMFDFIVENFEPEMNIVYLRAIPLNL